MAVRRLETDVLDCDICDEKCYFDCVPTLLKHLLAFAARDGWLITIDKHICPECRKKSEVREKLTLAALEEWPDTPEKLGECLEVATTSMPPPAIKGSSLYESDMRLRSEITDARRLLKDLPACRQLLEYEEVERRNGR